MDLQSLFFVLLMIAIGGFSAYLADILGYKIGKKRLSIKRIRPKYVARISVVIAGMLIPIITMAFMYAVSSTFRTWLIEGSRIVETLAQKNKEVDAQDKTILANKELEAKLQNEQKIIKSQLDLNNAELKKQTTQLDDQKKKLAELQASVTSAKAAAETAKREKAAAQEQLRLAKAKLDPLEAELKAKQKKVDDADAKFKFADANYKDTVKRYNETNTENLRLTNKNAELLKANEEIKKNSDMLQISVATLGKDIELLKSQKSTAEADTFKAKADLKKAQEDLVATQAMAQAAERGVENFYRLQPISYLHGEELTRISIPGGVSQTDATNIYRAMLRRAKSVATDHGAKPDPDNPFSGSAGSLLIGSGRSYMTESEVETYWVGQMRRSRNDSVMIARAAMNQFGTEAIALEIVIKPNPIVFRKGEIVVESKIDGRMSEIEVLGVIRDFLRSYVNTRARQRAMIPVQGRDGESYGEFTQDQLLAAVAKVKAVTRNARLVAIARQDIRAGDQLDIDIEVR